MSIHNDMWLLVYIEMKKITQDCGKYPLCIRVKVNNIHHSGTSLNDLTSTNDMKIDIHEFLNCDTVPLIDGGNEHDQQHDFLEDIGIIDDPLSQTIVEGQLYKDKDTIVGVMKRYALRKKFQFKVKRSSATRYSLECVNDQCTWFCKSSSLHKFNNFRSKKKALESLGGNTSESYGKLPEYLYMLMHSNPGSVVSLSKTDEGHFMYTFVALNASIKGWEYCRPIVVDDGSFHKASHRGTFLTTCTQDASGPTGFHFNVMPLKVASYEMVDPEAQE
ncbi:hypothetical protein RND71_025380 [Anisodus tanguticus]|uniref:Transposase MuDR plant domain-containing protein n=1 Tax=Anisodus tanguticus TaxID=243964 RepID=A0AAE1VCN0_9SOLA|nr:hypothetical protein RND71_025380 [Anisodus tanguticus]